MSVCLSVCLSVILSACPHMMQIVPQYSIFVRTYETTLVAGIELSVHVVATVRTVRSSLLGQ